MKFDWRNDRLAELDTAIRGWLNDLSCQYVSHRLTHLFDTCATSNPASDVPELLLQDGNCIPLALHRLLHEPASASVYEHIRQSPSATSIRSRSDADFSKLLHEHGKHLALSVGCRIRRPGSYLLHSDHDCNCASQLP